MPKLLQRQKPAPKWYPFALVALIVLVHLLDTYATDVATKVQSLYVNEFFVRGQGLSFEAGLQRATLISTMGYAFAIVGPFYKALMDKIGRRPIFIINTAGMALGMLLCWYAPNFYLFAAGQRFSQSGQQRGFGQATPILPLAHRLGRNHQGLGQPFPRESFFSPQPRDLVPGFGDVHWQFSCSM